MGTLLHLLSRPVRYSQLIIQYLDVYAARRTLLFKAFFLVLTQLVFVFGLAAEVEMERVLNRFEAVFICTIIVMWYLVFIRD